MDFSNLFIPYVVDVKESVFRSLTQLFCFGDLENQLPVLQLLEGTDDWVLRIFVISSFSTFSRSRNLFHRATMFGWPWKSRSTSGFGGTLRYCRLGLMDFSNFLIPYVFDVKESVYRSFKSIKNFKSFKSFESFESFKSFKSFKTFKSY